MDRFRRRVASSSSRVIASLQQVAASGSPQEQQQQPAPPPPQAQTPPAPQVVAPDGGAAMPTAWLMAADATAHLTEEERGVLLEVFKKEERFQRETIRLVLEARGLAGNARARANQAERAGGGRFARHSAFASTTSLCLRSRRRQKQWPPPPRFATFNRANRRDACQSISGAGGRGQVATCRALVWPASTCDCTSRLVSGYF